MYPAAHDLLNSVADQIEERPEIVLLEVDGTGARDHDGRHVDPLHVRAACWRPSGLVMKEIGHEAHFGRAVNSEEAHAGKALMGQCERLLQLAAGGTPIHLHGPKLDAKETYMWFRLAAMMAPR